MPVVPDDEDEDEVVSTVDGGKALSSSSVVSATETTSSNSVLARKKLRIGTGSILSSALLARFADPSSNLNMFESREAVYTVDDYGVSNTDLTFGDISTIDTRW